MDARHLDQLTGANVLTTIYLKSAYWPGIMHTDSREKTAISTHRGLFQLKRMQFGFTNASAVFQRMMNSVLANCLGRSCLIYLDDIVIYSKNEEPHKIHVAEVLATLVVDKKGIRRVLGLANYFCHLMVNYADAVAPLTHLSYLYGADFVIHTNHKPLKCLFQKEMKNSCIQQ